MMSRMRSFVGSLDLLLLCDLYEDDEVEEEGGEDGVEEDLEEEEYVEDDDVEEDVEEDEVEDDVEDDEEPLLRNKMVATQRRYI